MTSPDPQEPESSPPPPPSAPPAAPADIAAPPPVASPPHQLPVPYTTPPPPFAGEPHRGTLVLVFGILSIALCFTFWCAPIGLGLGLPAWFMGRRDLAKMDRGVMDPAGRSLTNAGMVCGIVGTVLAGLFCLGILLYFLFFAVLIGGAVLNA